MPKSVYTRESEIVAKALAKARRASGLHQAEVASMIGRDQTVISNIERGQRRVDLIEFYQVANAVGRDPVELFGSIIRQWNHS